MSRQMQCRRNSGWGSPSRSLENKRREADAGGVARCVDALAVASAWAWRTRRTVRSASDSFA